MDVNELITTLSRLLEEPYEAHREVPKAPNRLDKELESICSQHQQRNALLDVGFQAWFACYFLAESSAQASFVGLSDSEQQAVARRICSVKPHSTIEIMFQHVFYRSFRGSSRRAMMDKAGYRYPERQDVFASGSAPTNYTASLQRQNREETHTENQQVQAEDERPHLSLSYTHPNSSSAPPLANNANPGVRLPPLMTSIHQGIGLPPLGEHSQSIRTMPLVDDQSIRRVPERSPYWEAPSAKNIPLLFPHQMCTSVVIKNRVAGVRAFFPDEPSQCRLEVDIYSSKIPYIARELFGLNFEMTEGSLVLRPEAGSSVFFKEITLCGADRRAAEKILGAAFTSISADDQYSEELDQGKPLTDLIMLKIHDSGDPSCLTVRGTTQTITKISAQLWPSFPQA